MSGVDTMNLFKREKIADGVYFDSINDSRFKTMRISANAIVPLSQSTASANALLCGVLARSCKEYPDFTLLSKKLSSLYGAELSTSVRKAGDSQVLTISAAGLDDRYAFAGESISRDLSILLCNVLFEPNICEQSFNFNEVEQERRQLFDLIDSEFNDKRIYANNKLIENMCHNEVFGIKRYGTREEIQKITPQSLYKTWKNLLESAVFEIMYISDTPADNALKVFSSSFKDIKRTPCECKTNIVRSAEKINHVSEEMNLSQSKLVMGFRTDSAVGDKQVNATRLICAILGGTANSKLFCNVREKQSLCYYCSSRYDRIKGIMTIDSGVEGKNIDKAEKAILNEIADMKKGIISDFEIQATKLAVINSFKTTNDTVGGIEAWYSSQLFDGEFKTIQQVSQEINSVTGDEIILAAQMLTLDTVYVLKNK